MIDCLRDNLFEADGGQVLEMLHYDRIDIAKELMLLKVITVKNV